MAVYSTGITDTVTENYLEGSTPTNVIPSYATLDEMAFHVIESSEADFNAMMMECGVIELAYVEENHQEMVYEAGKVKGLIDKAVNMFKKMWSNVQGLIQKALAAFDKKAQEFREKVMKKIDKNFLQKRVDNVKANKDFGKTYKYKNIENYATQVDALILNADHDVQTLVATAKSKAKNGEAVTDGLSNDLDKVVNGLIEKLHGNAKTKSVLVKFMKDDIRTEPDQVDGTWVKANYKTIIDEVTNYPKTKKTLKQNYKSTQKLFNEAIKSCKKENDGKMFEANVFTKAIKAYKDLRQISIYAQQAVISCLNERQGFYRMVLIKLIGTKPVKESVSEATTIDGISSLFEW